MDTTFGGTWPFEPRWLATDGVRLHYVDEGPRDGEPVLMLHGTPTWSYLYRDLIAALAEHGFRAIAYDQLGFGRSDKPGSTAAYSLARHIRHLDSLVGELGLSGITLVVHDWGGPIGLGWAVDHAELVQRLIVFNTHTGAVDEGRAPWAYALVRAPVLGDLLTRGANVFALALRYATDLDEDERRAYAAAHPSWTSRAALAKAPRLLPFDAGNPSRPVVANTIAKLGRLHAKPTLFVWGMRDPILRPRILRRLTELLGDSEARQIEHASHYVQENAPDEVRAYLLDFLDRTTRRAESA